MDSSFEFNDRGRGPKVSTHYSLSSPDFAPLLKRLRAQVQRGVYTGGLPIREKASQLFKDSYAGMLRMTKKMYDTGIPILAGTDATAGLMLHREFELKVRAAIPPAKALQISQLQRLQAVKTR